MQAGGAAGLNAAVVNSRVVRFPLMVIESDLSDGDKWEDFLDDAKQGCQNHEAITSLSVCLSLPILVTVINGK